MTSPPNASPSRAVVAGATTVAFVGPAGNRTYKYGPIAYIDANRPSTADAATVDADTVASPPPPRSAPAGGASTASLNGSLASRRRRRAPADFDDPNSTGWLVALQQKLFENYHLVAYTVVISTYFLAFCEYVYLRLISIVFPDRLVYYQQCRKHANETIERNEIHFASTIIVFVAVGFFQLTCFYLLTVSERWLDVRRTVSTHFVGAKERLRHELAFAIRRVMFSTVFAAFAVYAMCSTVVVCAIFYIVGVRDAVDVGSQVLAHFFDGCAIMYFMAFPVVCILFHPDIWPGKRRKLQASPTGEHRYAAPSGGKDRRPSGSVSAAEDVGRRRQRANDASPRTAAVQQQQQRRQQPPNLNHRDGYGAGDRTSAERQQSPQRRCIGGVETPSVRQDAADRDQSESDQHRKKLKLNGRIGRSDPPAKTADRLTRLVDKINTLPTSAGRPANRSAGATGPTSGGMQALQNRLRAADRYKRLGEPTAAEVTTPAPPDKPAPSDRPATAGERRTKL